MKFLLDVCASSRSLQAFLLAQGHDALSAIAIDPKAGDERLMAMAHQDERVLVTEDKDFGELIFVRRQPHGPIVRLVELNHRPAGSRWVRQSAESPTCRSALRLVYSKVVVLFRHLLRPYVFHDNLVGHVTRTRHEEPSRPKVPPPALLVQMAELLQQPP